MLSRPQRPPYTIGVRIVVSGESRKPRNPSCSFRL